MKFYLTEEDLRRKILRGFEEHGVQVKTCSISYGSEGVGCDPEVRMMIEVDDASDTSLGALIKPRNLAEDIRQLASALGEILQRVNALNERVDTFEATLDEHLSEPATESVATNTARGQRTPQGKNKHDRRNPRPTMKPALEKMRQQIEREANVIGNPLGSTLVKGERPMGPNESEEFPE